MTITFVDGWDPRGFEGVLIEDIEMPKHRIFSGPGPLPWQVADLRAAVGSRVIVAAPVELTEWIPRALPLAEAAATVADRYLRWADLPGPYVIYLGRPGDLDNWFRGGSDPARELGIAFPVARYDIQVFIKIPDAADLTKGDGLRAIIQHELGHVVTLAGVEMDTDDSLIEGIAEYIGHAGQPISHIRDEDVRRYLRSGKWDGSIRLTEEISDQDMGVVNAAYGIGYLTMRHLADRYGEAHTFGFFSDVERHHVDIDHSSWARFGAPWQTVNEDCVGYIRSVVRP